MIEAEGVLSGTAASVAAAGLFFGVHRGAEDDAVAIGSGGPDYADIEDPSGNGFLVGIFIFDEVGVGIVGIAEECFDTDPIAAFFEENDFASAFGLGELVRIGVGREVDDGLDR